MVGIWTPGPTAAVQQCLLAPKASWNQHSASVIGPDSCVRDLVLGLHLPSPTPIFAVRSVNCHDHRVRLFGGFVG